MQSDTPNTSRQRWFALISIIAGTLIGLSILEAGLRFYQYRVRHSEYMAPGFILYDDLLGWKLARNWTGRHETFEYEVTYRTNDEGFRRSNSETRSNHACAVLGDSFTFGLGVNDDETFVEIMNREVPDTRFINYAVPGYSTDQQWLLLKQNPRIHSHGCLLLVVYLANDLFDNLLPFPLQAEHAKPYIELKQDEFLVRNQPVPLLTKPPQQQTIDLARLNAPRSFDQPLLRRVLHVSALGGLLIDYLAPETYSANGLDDRFVGEIEVFQRLLKNIRTTSAATQPILVLLPGRSYVELPSGFSAAIQEYFRNRLKQLSVDNGIPVIDLATALRSDYKSTHASLFYPKDGHLNVEGHARTADILRKRLKNLPAVMKIPD